MCPVIVTSPRASSAMLVDVALTSPIDGAVDPPVELMTPLPSIVTVEPSTLTPPRVPLAVTPAVGSV